MQKLNLDLDRIRTTATENYSALTKQIEELSVKTQDRETYMVSVKYLLYYLFYFFCPLQKKRVQSVEQKADKLQEKIDPAIFQQEMDQRVFCLNINFG